MFFKPNAIVYLRRDDLIVGGKRITPGRLKIPISVMNNLEIQDPDQFLTLTREFLVDHALKGKRVIVVLDQNIIFSKTVDLQKLGDQNIDELLENYISEMPVAEGERAILGYQSGDNLQIFATNAQLFERLINSLQLSGVHKIVAVTPAEAYDIDFQAKSADIINGLLTDKKIRKKINFASSAAS